MSSEQEQFDKLRVLLSLKRHEQPPPGYFEKLSSEIISHIRGQTFREEPSLEERIAWEIPWLRRFWQALEVRPMTAGGLGVAVCCLLLAGVAWHTAPVSAPETFMPVQSLAADSAASPVVFSQPLAAPVAVPSAILASTGEVMSLTPAPVRRNPFVMPASDVGFR